MPANAQKVNKENAYYHISNKGRDGKAIFNEASDFDTFISYLNEYLTSPSDVAVTKKAFTVQGKTFHGVPHQPKNYHKKIELVAYNLTPNSFNLLVKQNETSALESFVRSLCTRYSIYFNKKYQKTGSLFEGPYKSIHLDDESQINLLIYHLHKIGGRSSIDKYIDTNPPDWASSQININTYRDFVDKYEPSQSQKETIEALTFGNKTRSFEKQITQVALKPEVKHIGHKIPKHLEMHQRVPELLLASATFLVLLTFGIKNITTFASENVKQAKEKMANTSTGLAVDEGQVAGITIESLDETYNTTVKKFVQVKLDDKLLYVSIYNDIYKSQEILTAGNGAKLEFIAINGKWSEIKLQDGTNGFIETKYTESLEINQE